MPWHINPFPPHAEPIDWTGRSFTTKDIKIHDFWRIGRVTVTVRAGDYQVHVDDDQTMRAWGKTVAEAIGSLVLSYPELVSTPEQTPDRTLAVAAREPRRHAVMVLE